MASSQKLLSLFVLLGVLAAFVTAEVEQKSIPKNLILGYREPQDYLIQQEEIKKSRAFLGYVQYEKTFVGDNHSVITQVRIIDMDTHGNGAIVKVITAGPGSTFVTIYFNSLLNKGINHKVEIYGKKPVDD